MEKQRYVPPTALMAGHFSVFENLGIIGPLLRGEKVWFGPKDYVGKRRGPYIAPLIHEYANDLLSPDGIKRVSAKRRTRWVSSTKTYYQLTDAEQRRVLKQRYGYYKAFKVNKEQFPLYQRPKAELSDVSEDRPRMSDEEVKRISERKLSMLKRSSQADAGYSPKAPAKRKPSDIPSLSGDSRVPYRENQAIQYKLRSKLRERKNAFHEMSASAVGAIGAGILTNIARSNRTEKVNYLKDQEAAALQYEIDRAAAQNVWQKTRTEELEKAADVYLKEMRDFVVMDIEEDTGRVIGQDNITFEEIYLDVFEPKEVCEERSDEVGGSSIYCDAQYLPENYAGYVSFSDERALREEMIAGLRDEVDEIYEAGEWEAAAVISADAVDAKTGEVYGTYHFDAPEIDAPSENDLGVDIFFPEDNFNEWRNFRFYHPYNDVAGAHSALETANMLLAGSASLTLALMGLAGWRAKALYERHQMVKEIRKEDPDYKKGSFFENVWNDVKMLF